MLAKIAIMIAFCLALDRFFRYLSELEKNDWKRP